jgi:hypothetical protein
MMRTEVAIRPAFLSNEALALLRYRLATKNKTVTDTNREDYRELA